MVRGKILAK